MYRTQEPMLNMHKVAYFWKLFTNTISSRYAVLCKATYADQI